MKSFKDRISKYIIWIIMMDYLNVIYVIKIIPVIKAYGITIKIYIIYR
jgi:hypothetical protein